MKPNRWYTAAGLLLFFLLCLVPSGEAQQGSPVPYANPPAQLALTWTFTSSSPATGGFTLKGLSYWQVFFVPAGTVSACALSFDSSIGSGFTTGGVIAAATIGSCASAGSYSNSTATTPTLLGQLTPTITGSGSVTVVLLGYVNNPATSGGGGGGGNSTIVSPLDVSGNVKVNCEAGCSNGSYSSAIAFQQAVTASAVALSSNSTHGFCVQALSSNALTVYVGPSGVTTSTGFPLSPGVTACFQLSNSNIIYVIASSTGSSVAVTGD